MFYSDKLVIGVIVICLSSLGGVIYYETLKEREWEVFKVAHECKVIGKEKGSLSLSPIIGPNGSVSFLSTSTPSKTGWLCNDEVTYWR